MNVLNGFTWVGENAGASATTATLSGTGEWRTHTMSVGQNTTTLPGAILNLDGGTVRTQRFIGARESNDGSDFNCLRRQTRSAESVASISILVPGCGSKGFKSPSPGSLHTMRFHD